jgi:hypothetical protein
LRCALLEHSLELAGAESDATIERRQSSDEIAYLIE